MNNLSILLRFDFNLVVKDVRISLIYLSILLRFDFNDFLTEIQNNPDLPFNPIKVRF